TATKDGMRKAAAPTPAPADIGNEQKADNGRITLKSIGAGGREEAMTIDLPRPPIPAAVVSLVTRKESSDRPSQMGDVIPADVGEGFGFLTRIMPTSAGPGGGIARRMAPSQTPYYQVLVKGERPIPKPGRADDFSWPRVEQPDLPVEPPPTRRPGRPPTP